VATIKGTTRADVISGSRHDDRVTAGAGDDLVYGGAGNDILQGEAGDDRIYGEAGNDRLTGGTGSDLLEGGAGDDWISDTAGNDMSTNRMFGGDGQDQVYGGMGVDYIYGDAGHDLLDGFVGADHLYGGGGADTFRFFAPAGSTNGTPSGGFAGLAGGVDTIYDFNAAQGDRIDLSLTDAVDSSPYDGPDEGTNDAFTFVGAEQEGAVHQAGDLTITYENGMTVVRGYVDDDQVADLVFHVINPADITTPIVSPGDIFF
jgi:Ca2+-binding RTX toxin-like protein